MPAPQLLRLLIATLCFLGLGRIACSDLWGRRHWVRGDEIDARYEDVVGALPATARLGYLTDEPQTDPFSAEGYTRAQYALTPRVLLQGDAGVDLWLADLRDPRSLDRLCEQGSLEPVTVLSAGHLALLRRKRR